MCSLYKGVKKAGKVCIILYIYKEYNKSMGKGGKRVKSCGKVYSSLYIEYIIKEYIRVRKVRGKR